jgi:hypothetical protein
LSFRSCSRAVKKRFGTNCAPLFWSDTWRGVCVATTKWKRKDGKKVPTTAFWRAWRMNEWKDSTCGRKKEKKQTKGKKGIRAANTNPSLSLSRGLSLSTKDQHNTQRRRSLSYTARMAFYCMPFMIVNMGGEMLYILEQRLNAQHINPEKSNRGWLQFSLFPFLLPSLVPRSNNWPTHPYPKQSSVRLPLRCLATDSATKFSDLRNCTLQPPCEKSSTAWPTPPSCDWVNPAWTRWDLCFRDWEKQRKREEQAWVYFQFLGTAVRLDVNGRETPVHER